MRKKATARQNSALSGYGTRGIRGAVKTNAVDSKVAAVFLAVIRQNELNRLSTAALVIGDGSTSS